MSDQPLMPSEVRRKVLSQHREIEQMLSELEAGVAQLGAGAVDAGQVKRAAYALRGILELHMNFEEAHMVPAIEEADGFGPERVRHLHAEHGSTGRSPESLLRADPVSTPYFAERPPNLPIDPGGAARVPVARASLFASCMDPYVGGLHRFLSVEPGHDGSGSRVQQPIPALRQIPRNYRGNRDRPRVRQRGSSSALSAGPLVV